jgi:hypothetical protein
MDWNTLALSTWLTPFLPRFILSAVILLLGFLVAQAVTKAVRRLVVRLFSQKQVADSPLGEVVMPMNSLRGSGLFSSIVYALVLFLFIAIAGEVLGITFFSQIVSLVLAFVPNLAAALVVLVLGFLLAGIAERVVKQQFRRFFPSQALLAGTIASSSVIVLFFLMAIAELGIAQEFIFILFAGVVFTISLGVGLALGLGGQDTVREMLRSFVHRDENNRSSGNK